MWYERNPLLIHLVDKYKVKDFARSRGVNTAGLLFVTERPKLISPDDDRVVRLDL